MLKDTEDFYENKHTNSDLIAVNFTQYSDEEVYKKLYEANMKLISKYIEVQENNYRKECEKLYFERNAAFRGFRHT